MAQGTLAYHFIKASARYNPKQLINTPETYLKEIQTHFFDHIDFNNTALDNSTFKHDKINVGDVVGLVTGAAEGGDVGRAELAGQLVQDGRVGGQVALLVEGVEKAVLGRGGRGQQRGGEQQGEGQAGRECGVRGVGGAGTRPVRRSA